MRWFVACDTPAPVSSNTAAAPVEVEPSADTAVPTSDAPSVGVPIANPEVAPEIVGDGPPSDELAPSVPPSDVLPMIRPDRFGEIHPELPPPAADTLTVHGLAGFEVVAIHVRPDLESPRLGYLRFGQRVMVTAAVPDQGKECAKGFHGLPAGGFVCASKGFQVSADAAPYMFMPPPPPAVDAPIPYDYGVVAKDGTPLWWKMPDGDEVELAVERFAAIVEATKTPEERAAEERAAAKRNPKPDDDDDDDEPPAADDGGDAVDDDAEPEPKLTREELAAQRKAEEDAKQREQERLERERERAVERMRKASRLPLNSKSPFLESGFVITLGEKTRGEGRSWWRTTRGAFVESRLVWRKKTTDFHGGEIPAGTTRFGFVDEEVGSASVMSPKGKLTWKRKLGFRELVAFTSEVDVAGRSYFVTADGLYVAASILRMAELATRPTEVRDYERWIDVDLERQMLVAYEGDVPVYATLVSTGKKGTEEESFLTPTGKFRITTKHISSSMDGNTASDGSYSIQDVPWAMFFHGNFALHGAFWHSKFGSRRSHGCVNLGPTDARWLFGWTTPFLPETWHGVSAHAGAPGSMVVIH